MREIACYWDEAEGRWKAEFNDSQLISGCKVYGLRWTDKDDEKKVLTNMRKNWKTHSVSIRGSHQHHPSLAR